jgi:dihydropteroate synthase
MGVLNVTPDSFSDGGDHLAIDSAIEHGLRLTADGADLVDVGGESTRPGALRPSPEVEMARVLPVVEALTAAGVAVSVDTMRSRVAAAAVDAGAVLVNDVSGGLADRDMATGVADSGVAYVAMHWRAHSAQMADHAVYRDVVSDVAAELRARLEGLLTAGVRRDRIILDPGLGFAKTAAHNWALLRQLPRLAELCQPLLVGASRKAFLGELLATPDGRPAPAERDGATAAVSALAAAAGAFCVRVHDVRRSRDAVEVAAAWGTALLYDRMTIR